VLNLFWHVIIAPKKYPSPTPSGVPELYYGGKHSFSSMPYNTSLYRYLMYATDFGNDVVFIMRRRPAYHKQQTKQLLAVSSM